MNRRDWAAGAAAYLVFGAPKRTRAEAGDAISRTGESIHQEPVFPAGRKRVYDALMDPKSFGRVERMSGAMQSGMSLGNKPTAISPQVGGAFTLFGGHIVGRHIELVPNQRIVQAWRVADWTPGIYSLVRFELTDNGSGSKILFDHLAFPEGKAEHLAAGWTQNYWEPLRKFLV
jgi:activator of HSP90 ATPase